MRGCEKPSSRSSRLSHGSKSRTSCSYSSHTGDLPYSRGDRRASLHHWDRRSRPRPRYTVSRGCSNVLSRNYGRCTAGLQIQGVKGSYGPESQFFTGRRFTRYAGRVVESTWKTTSQKNRCFFIKRSEGQEIKTSLEGCVGFKTIL